MKRLVFAAALGAAMVCAAAEHVVVIGVDGCGARWMPWDAMPNTKALRDSGLFTVARCHRITASAINWKSMFSGQPPEVHGFSKWNSSKPEIEPSAYALDAEGRMPCIFSEIRRQRPSARTAAFFTWDGVGNIMNTNAIDTAILYTSGKEAYPALEDYPAKDALAFDSAIAEFSNAPALMLAYQGQVDSFGHKFGWGSPEFTNACVNVDANIGKLVAALESSPVWQDTAIIFIADHGGLGKRHGGVEDVRVFEVPFIVTGPAAKKYKALREPAMLEDVAPTIAMLLGIEAPPAWRGRAAVVE